MGTKHRVRSNRRRASTVLGIDHLYKCCHKGKKYREHQPIKYNIKYICSSSPEASQQSLMSKASNSDRTLPAIIKVDKKSDVTVYQQSLPRESEWSMSQSCLKLHAITGAKQHYTLPKRVTRRWKMCRLTSRWRRRSRP